MTTLSPCDNQSLAQSNKFSLVFEKLPFVTFFCKEIQTPSIDLTPAQFANPFVDLPSPGDKIQYGTIEVQFLIDSSYLSYSTVYDWITGLAFPENFDQYLEMQTQSKNIAFPLLNKGQPQFSDAILVVYSNKNNPLLRFKYRDAFPTSLSGLQFNTENTAEFIMSATASFAFSYFTIERI